MGSNEGRENDFTKFPVSRILDQFKPRLLIPLYFSRVLYHSLYTNVPRIIFLHTTRMTSTLKGDALTEPPSKALHDKLGSELWPFGRLCTARRRKLTGEEQQRTSDGDDDEHPQLLLLYCTFIERWLFVGAAENVLFCSLF